MKPKYIIGIAAALVLIATALFSLENKKIEYKDFTSAAESGSKAQIAGSYVKDKGSKYDPATNQFRFTMRDEKGVELPVVFDGAKPNNFELATSIVVTGSVEKGVLNASGILTKCPSKYEGSGSGLKTSSADTY